MYMHMYINVWGAKFEPICVYCGSSDVVVDAQSDYLPQCADCADKEKINSILMFFVGFCWFLQVVKYRK